jgi:hypothetical protein
MEVFVKWKSRKFPFEVEFVFGGGMVKDGVGLMVAYIYSANFSKGSSKSSGKGKTKVPFIQPAKLFF